MGTLTELSNVNYTDPLYLFEESLYNSSSSQNAWNYDSYTPIGLSNTSNDDESGESCSSAFYTTAFNKSLNFPNHEDRAQEWNCKPVHQWTESDTLDWVVKVAEDNALICEEIHNFRDVNGHTLLTMSETKFIALESNCGRALFADMQRLKQNLQNLPLTIDDSITSLGELPERPIKIEHSYQRENEIESQLREDRSKKIRRGPGRPRGIGRKKNDPDKKTGRLWEFIRDLLLKPEYCPSMICWEDYDHGVFRFVHSEGVAKLWGSRKDNPKMTYEKLSRAMRYYYRSKVLQPVLGRRLVYKFGPTATGWHTDDPNFKFARNKSKH